MTHSSQVPPGFASLNFSSLELISLQPSRTAIPDFDNDCGDCNNINIFNHSTINDVYKNRSDLIPR